MALPRPGKMVAVRGMGGSGSGETADILLPLWANREDLLRVLSFLSLFWTERPGCGFEGEWACWISKPCKRVMGFLNEGPGLGQCALEHTSWFSAKTEGLVIFPVWLPLGNKRSSQWRPDLRGPKVGGRRGPAAAL